METGECEVKKTHGGKRKEVADSRPMYAAIFIFLALSALIFLLRNINILKTRFKSLPSSKAPECSPPPPHHDSSPWSCQGQELSPEDALEERSLIESIRWPESPHFPNAPHFKQTSDPAHSHFTILPAEGAGEWHVGDRLEALIRMHDFQGQPKLYGGDFLLARLHDPSLEAGVAGQVVDHLNGSYSAVFPLLWEGRAQVEVTLVHPSEAVGVLRRLTREQPGRVFFQSGFRSGSLSENTVCNVCLPPSQERTLCNYTNLHTGEPWYCYKPNALSCDDRIDHKRCVHHTNISSEEALLFQSNVNIKIHIRASGTDSIKVQPKKNQAEPDVESSSRVKPSAGPSGYYYQGVWRALTGIDVGHFDDASAISQCLKYKMVHLYGDSTVRQWFEYLKSALPELKEINLNGPPHVGPYMAVDSGRNTMLTYRCHGPPLSFTVVPVNELRYVANELEGLAGGADTVVVISVWAHFDPFPPDVYIKRLRGIRRSVARLLRRAPATLVVVRSANPRALDREMSLTYSDWFSSQRDTLLKAMFRRLEPAGVVLVDAWEMTLAHRLPHDIHPPHVIVKNMIDLLLSHVCPPAPSPPGQKNNIVQRGYILKDSVR